MRPRRPPDEERPGGAAAQPGRRSGSLGRRAEANPSDDPREFQGIANRRSPKQRPPRWNPPRGTQASADLEALFGLPRRFVVVVIALDRRTEWGRFANAEAANDAATRLLRHGMHALVERIGGES